ncbi:Aste57867_12378 [Aphanomyces stellatus]|uniref:Aste57867_12378 protein n=1 Tax=Aphanomyces stellatus TaxID=120398 RepID=A0A485KWS5_9STRA|nr:hypothetical protein As57867_012332 [Aphanomyces stellatus]VFT89230.1 Aste57867_12378 [Aphanomyces stellatus]
MMRTEAARAEMQMAIDYLQRQIQGFKSNDSTWIEDLDALVDSPDVTMEDVLVFSNDKFPHSRALWDRVGPTIPPGLAQAFYAYKAEREEVARGSFVPSTPTESVDQGDKGEVTPPSSAKKDDDKLNTPQRTSTRIRSKQGHASSPKTPPKPSQGVDHDEDDDEDDDDDDEDDDDDDDDGDSESDMNTPLVSLRKRAASKATTAAARANAEDDDDDGDETPTPATTSKRKVGRPRKAGRPAPVATRVSARHSATADAKPAAPSRRKGKKKVEDEDEDITPTRRKSARRVASAQSTKGGGTKKKKYNDSD